MKPKKPDMSSGMLPAMDLKSVADQIEMQGGSRQQLTNHIGDRAETLSDVIAKLRSKGGSVGKMIGGQGAKKGLAALAGPVGIGLSMAQDAMASEDANVGSDEVGEYPMEEALLEQPYENFADKDVSDQARRFQKIRSLMGQ